MRIFLLCIISLLFSVYILADSYLCYPEEDIEFQGTLIREIKVRPTPSNCNTASINIILHFSKDKENEHFIGKLLKKNNNEEKIYGAFMKKFSQTSVPITISADPRIETQSMKYLYFYSNYFFEVNLDNDKKYRFLCDLIK